MVKIRRELTLVQLPDGAVDRFGNTKLTLQDLLAKHAPDYHSPELVLWRSMGYMQFFEDSNVVLGLGLNTTYEQEDGKWYLSVSAELKSIKDIEKGANGKVNKYRQDHFLGKGAHQGHFYSGLRYVGEAIARDMTIGDVIQDKNPRAIDHGWVDGHYYTLRLYDPTQAVVAAAVPEYRKFVEFARNHAQHINDAAKLVEAGLQMHDLIPSDPAKRTMSGHVYAELDRTTHAFYEKADKILATLNPPTRLEAFQVR